MLDRAQVQHVANLARLELDDEEVERMAAELSKVLDHVERIRELDLEGVPPTSHVVDVAGVVRADEPAPCLPREVVLTAAGRAAIESAAPRHVAAVRRLVFDQMDSEQAVAFGQTFEAILAGLEDSGPV